MILFISTSLDGYLATKDDNLSFLDAMSIAGKDYGYSAFTKEVDTYIVGRKTYDVVRDLLHGEFPQANQFECYVITRQIKEPENGVKFYSGSLKELVESLKAKTGKNIYCDGGGEIVRLLLQDGLIDEMIISIIPVLLGSGKRLFLEHEKPQTLQLTDVKPYETGLVQLRYERK